MKRYNITVNGNSYDVAVEELSGSAAPVASTPVAATPAPSAKAPVAAAPVADGTKVSAPMPGTILEIKAKVGDTVAEGDSLFVLEAMKMENDVNAPCAGKIVSVTAEKGAQVETGSVLAVIQ